MRLPLSVCGEQQACAELRRTTPDELFALSTQNGLKWLFHTAQLSDPSWHQVNLMVLGGQGDGGVEVFTGTWRAVLGQREPSDRNLTVKASQIVCARTHYVALMVELWGWMKVRKALYSMTSDEPKPLIWFYYNYIICLNFFSRFEAILKCPT